MAYIRDSTCNRLHVNLLAFPIELNVAFDKLVLQIRIYGQRHSKCTQTRQANLFQERGDLSWPAESTSPVVRPTC